MGFKIVKRLDLGFLGKEWKEAGCFLEFTAATWKEAERFARMTQGKDPNDPKLGLTLGKAGMDLLKEHFIRGKAIDENGKVIDVKAKSLDDFPPSVIMKALTDLTAEISPNA